MQQLHHGSRHTGHALSLMTVMQPVQMSKSERQSTFSKEKAVYLWLLAHQKNQNTKELYMPKTIYIVQHKQIYKYMKIH